jgi:nitroreductase
MDVSEAIRLKRAVRKFTPDPLPEEVIFAILNAGRRAQSSKNAQPWQFIAITDKATCIIKRLISPCLQLISNSSCKAAYYLLSLYQK